MGKNKEHKVGDIINVTLEIKEQENINEGCKGCFFEGSDKCGAAYFYSPCSKKFRLDGKSIIFKEVKE